MRAVCLDDSASAALEKGQEYYVFPNGPRAFYVSKFDSSKAHFGAFSAERFKVIEEAAYYRAVVGGGGPWWRDGKEYIIGPAKTDGYYNVHRLEDGAIIATLNNDFFRKIEACERPVQKTQIKPLTGVLTKRGANTKEVIEKPKIKQEMKPKAKITVVHKKKPKPPKEKKKNKYEQLEDVGQMTLFDF